MKVNIFNQTTCCISPHIKQKIISLVEYTIKEECTILDNLNIVITNDTYIKALNKKFLMKNRPTNVLSFNMEEVSEIYISYDRVDNPDDLFYYIVHGLLHIIGYDHRKPADEKVMKNKCLQYLRFITKEE